MKLTEAEILDRVNRTEAERAGYVQKAIAWEQAWRLKLFERTPQEAIEQDSQEQVTLPGPRNVINLAQRLISTTPKIDVPTLDDPTAEGDKLAEKVENWLQAALQSINRQQNRNLISDLTWQALVRGRFCLEIKWVGDILPERLKKRQLPILVRTLDPLNVGIKRGTLYTHWAYYKCEEERINVKASFPKLKLDGVFPDDGGQPVRVESSKCWVIDFWWTDPKTGDIWNAILVDGKFAKKPQKTNYPDIPIYEGYGDTAPIEDEEFRGYSLLDGIVELWKYQCRLASQMGTGLLWHFWPVITVTSENGTETEDMTLKPGDTVNLEPGQEIKVLSVSPNVPMAQTMDGRIDAEFQNSTFPGIMYGKAPGELSAGYGVSLLSDAAKGRIKSTLENLEFGISVMCRQMLALLAEFAGKDYKKGVEVWGLDERSTKTYRSALTAKEAGQFTEAQVSLKPNVPQDLQQIQTLGLRLVEAKIISVRTYRDKFMNITVPADEQLRVELEEAMQSEEMLGLKAQAVLEKYFGPDFREILKIPPPEPPAPPPGPPPMQGPPGMPPGMDPSMMGGPPGMMPPGQAPAALTGPMGGGIPPEMQGQMTPEMMGLPANMDPIMFAQLTGRPMPPAEELNRLQGLPQGG